jgi:hypothetical protein
MYVCTWGCVDLVTPHHLEAFTKQNIKCKTNNATWHRASCDQPGCLQGCCCTQILYFCQWSHEWISQPSRDVIRSSREKSLSDSNIYTLKGLSIDKSRTRQRATSECEWSMWHHLACRAAIWPSPGEQASAIPTRRRTGWTRVTLLLGL